MTTYVLEGRRTVVVLLAVLAMIVALLALPATPVHAQTAACPDTIPSAGFTDLAGLSTETVDSIDCIAFYDITKGTGATTYGPTGNVTRWQMALFLTRQATAHGVALPDPPVSAGYTDLTGLSADAVKAINQLAELGITKGTSATTYSPNDNVTRWQMALFLARLVTAAGVALPDPPADAGFTDLTGLSADAVKAINQLAAAGIAKGTSATTYSPSAVVLRWQMALFLARTLEAGGVTPPAAGTESDAPELVSVTFDDDDADQTRLVYTFDEDVSIVGTVADFVLVDATGTLWDATEIDKGADDEVEAIFENDYVDVATVAAVKSGAVENIDGDINPAGSEGYASYTLDGLDLPDNDAPEVVAVGAFDNDDDTMELEFDQDMDAAVIDESLIYFVEEDGTVWPGDPAGLNNDTDDEIVYVELLGNPGTSDVGNVVRVFLAPSAVAVGALGNPPHSLDIKLNGETDEAPSLKSVDIDVPGKEVTFTFNRSIVDQAFTAGEFVLVSVDADGSVELELAAPADLDRDTSTQVIWDIDGLVNWRGLIVYAGIWDAAGLGTSTIEDFATGEVLEVGHFVNVSYPFPAGATAAPALVSSAGSASGLAGDEYNIETEWSQDLDDGTIVPGTLLLFEEGGADIDPDEEAPDVDDEMVTITVLDGNTGFDELDDGDIAIFSFDAGFAISPFGYASYPTSVDCGC